LCNPDKGILSENYYEWIESKHGIVEPEDVANFFQNTVCENDKRIWKAGNFDYRNYLPWKKSLNLVETLDISTIVVVIDSSCKSEHKLEPLKESVQKLHKIISEDAINRNGIIPTLLVLAHKQDLVECLSVKEISEKLDLNNESYSNLNWAILPTSTKKVGSIEVAMDWALEYRKFDSTVTFRRRTACGCVVA